MLRNVGPEDRIGRIVIGLALFLLIYLGTLTGTAAIVTGIVAAILVITGVLARCPVYKLIDVDTSVQEQSYTKPDDKIDF
ncbi:MAG: DUF2892 domain-containing protein [Sphingomicrobium sp.]